MKAFTLLTVFTLIASAQASVAYEVVGETRSCQVKTKILKRVTRDRSDLLVIHGRDVYQLGLVRRSEREEYYSSFTGAPAPLGKMTFEARLVHPHMSSLSELRIYLSGARLSCFIDG